MFDFVVPDPPGAKRGTTEVENDAEVWVSDFLLQRFVMESLGFIRSE